MNILYVGRFTTPKDAASLRVFGIAKALSEKNHHIEFLCTEEYSKTEITQNGFKYKYVFNKQISKPLLFKEWCTGSRTAKIISKSAQESSIDAIILYNATAIQTRKILSICKKHNILLYSDVTEWYEIGHGKGLAASLYAWLVIARIRNCDNKVNGVIAISDYLNDYYLKRKIKVIKIPPLFCYEPQNTAANGNDVPTFLYAGNPGTKDELNMIIESAVNINSRESKIKLVFIGTKKPKNAENLLKHNIVFLPKCSNSETIKQLKKADFTFLFRREATFAKAGYSTKLAESLYNGVPVLCNAIGGADLDIKHGYNGIKIEELSEQSVLKGLKEALDLSGAQLKELKENSADFGSKKYFYQNYCDVLSQFISQTEGN